jgi:hypothetical protein
MGALDRRFEHRIERQLAARKQQGVPGPHVARRANGASVEAVPGASTDRRAEIPSLACANR